MGRLRLPWPVPRSGQAGRAAPRGTLFSCRLLWCWIAFRPSCLTAEILKELSIWLEQHSCVFSGKALLIGLDRSVESEEIAITIEGGGENGIAFGIAVAANLFGLGVRLCDENGNFAISARADLLSALVSESAEFRRLALAFSLHPLINGLAVLLRQIGSSDAQVQHSNAHAGRFPVYLLAHPPSQLRALVPHHLDETGLAKHAAQGRDDQRR
jgi:hypothetical protein